MNRKTISATTSHFSDWALLEGMQIRPFYARVQLDQELYVSVASCTEVASDAPPEGLVYTCNFPDPPVATPEWSVVPSSAGTVRPTSPGSEGALEAAIYTAPHTQPDPSVVTLVARLWERAPRVFSLVSQVDVGKPPTFHGGFNVSSNSLFLLSAAAENVTVTPAVEDDGSYADDDLLTTFDMEGDLVIDRDGISMGSFNCTLTDAFQASLHFKTKMTLWKTQPLQNWGISGAWPVICDVGGGQTFTTEATFQWITGCATSASDYRLPLLSHTDLEDYYTRSQTLCPGVVGWTRVDWHFLQ